MSRIQRSELPFGGYLECDAKEPNTLYYVLQGQWYYAYGQGRERFINIATDFNDPRPCVAVPITVSVKPEFVRIEFHIRERLGSTIKELEVVFVRKYQVPASEDILPIIPEDDPWKEAWAFQAQTVQAMTKSAKKKEREASRLTSAVLGKTPAVIQGASPYEPKKSDANTEDLQHHILTCRRHIDALTRANALLQKEVATLQARQAESDARFGRLETALLKQVQRDTTRAEARNLNAHASSFDPKSLSVDQLAQKAMRLALSGRIEG